MSLTDHLLRSFGPDIGSLLIVPDFNGVFDVRVDDELVWSKDEQGDFPTNEQIEKAVKERVT